MTIVADGRWTGLHGIGRFAREILGRLTDLERLNVARPPLHPADPLLLALWLRRRRPAAFFSPGFAPPLPCGIPVVFTIHDLIHLRVPGESGPLRWLYYHLVVRPAARRAHAVLTVSEASRRDIERWTGLPPGRVVVVGNAASPAFSPGGPRVRRPRPYVLYVGNHKPHKNVPRLVAAMTRSRRLAGHDLVLAGPPDGRLRALAGRLGLGDRLVFAPAPDDDALAALYRGAALVACPSLVEGFGLPALEAMACGTPCVVSRSTAVAEVTAGAAVEVDARSVEGIAEGMEALAFDPGLRDSLATKGLRRAGLFSWDATADRVRLVLAGF